MKEFKNDSTATLSRFGRDKRERTVSSERVERRPRLQRDADGSDRAHSGRNSFNPNFTAENRPAGGDPERRSYADKPQGERRYGDKPYGAKPGYGAKPYGDRLRSDKPYGERKYGDKPYGERRSEDRPASDRPYGDRPTKPYGAKPSYGAKPYGDRPRSDKPYGERKFGDKPYGDRPRSDKPYGARKYGDKPAFARGRKGAPKRDERPKDYPRYDPNKQTGEIRLNRYIAQSGICSRREADDFISAGLVSVNGVVVTTLGSKVMPDDEVKFNDSRVEGEKKVYLVLNKPKGFVTSLEDPHADKTVMDLVKDACTERIYPVGRLDKNSVGLLLFTNDGDLTRQLTHPSYKKKKIYQVTLDKPLTRADMDAIAEGITLEDGEIHADEISYVKENKKEVGVEIHSGRNRVVRRIFEHLGYAVQKLDRVYYAGLTKKNLKRGAWRFLTRDEVNRLKSGQYE